MELRENINQLDENLKAFPEAENIFSEKQPWLKDHFLPLISMDLSALNPEWKGRVVHFLCPFEPYEGYIGDGLNYQCTCNWYTNHKTNRGLCKHILAVKMHTEAQK